MPEETAPVEEGCAARLLTRKIRVEVVDGPDRGLVADLTGPEARIGSGAGANLVLKDRTVSRLHLILRIEGEAIRVIDEGSRNGTVLDGTRVCDAWARPDSTIRLGDTTLCLRMLDELLELPVSPRERMGGLLGRSVAMRRIFSLLEQIAPTDARVLVEGETGTGKELVAEALHQASRRADRPLVVVDCSAVSATLIESELFGHAGRSQPQSDRRDRKPALQDLPRFRTGIGDRKVARQPAWRIDAPALEARHRHGRPRDAAARRAKG